MRTPITVTTCLGLIALMPLSYVANADESGPGLEEVVVTATKREERLVDLPLSATVVPTERLAATGGVKIDDYAARIPGLIVSNISSAGGDKSITLRGIGASFGSGPTVAVYINDVPFNNSTRDTRGFSIPDIDASQFQSIEVLRGPQGTLYGGGTIGGVLKLVGKPLDYDRSSGRVEAAAAAIDGGGEGYSARGSANIPLTERVALSASAHYVREPGFLRNLQLDSSNYNSATKSGGHMELGVKLAPSVTARLEGYVEYDDVHGNPNIDVASGSGAPLDPDLSVRRAPNTDDLRSDFQVGALHVDAALGFADLTSITSYRKNTVDSHWDYSPTLSPVLASIFGIPDSSASNISNESSSDKFTQEVRLTSPSARRFVWQIAGYYTDEKAKFLQQLFAQTAQTGVVYDLPVLGTTDARARYEETAIFANGMFSLADPFDVSAGIRYSRGKLSTEQDAFGVLLGSTSYAVESTEEPVTWMVSPRYHFAPDVMAYLRVASGYRPGGANQPVPGTPTDYGPDKALNYELGFKADVLEGRLNFDLAAFYIEWTNIQTFGLSSLRTSYIFNGGEAKSQGIEASVTWQPVGGLVLATNLAFTDAVLVKDLPPPNVGSKGDRLPEVPRLGGQLSADYEWRVWNAWTASAGASYRRVGSRPDAFEAGRYTLPSYETFDLRAGIHNDRYAFDVYGTNMNDARGQLSSLNLEPVRRVAIIHPRTVGLSFAAKF